MTKLLGRILLAFVVASALWSAPAPAAEAGAPRQAASCEAFGIRAQVREQVDRENTPIAGVTVTVTDAGGAEVATGVTDDAGVALLCLPARADYTVAVDESTLPEGVALRDPEPVQVLESQFTTNVRTLNFFTGEGRERETSSYWSQLAQNLSNGVRLGLVIAICSVGLSLIFGTTGLTNFAHGEMVTFGGLVAYLLAETMDLPFLLAAAITVALGGGFGLLLDWGLFARLRRKGIGLISQLVVSVGLSIFLVNFFLTRFGGDTRRYSSFNVQEGLDLGPLSITPRDLTTALISLVVLVAVAVALQRSRLGKATRAVSDNPDLAMATGIDSQRIIRIVWFLGGALAALGGVIRGLDEGVKTDMGADLLFLMFAGITLGGLGSAYGALLGGFIVGVFVELSTLGFPAIPEGPGLLKYIHTGIPPELKSVPALIALVVILLVRPQGILGRRQRVG